MSRDRFVLVFRMERAVYELIGSRLYFCEVY